MSATTTATSASSTAQPPDKNVVNADDCTPGEIRSGAGQLWRVAIDPLIEDPKKRNYFVPATTQLYIARKLKFDDEGRQFAMPPKFKHKHKFLPQRRIPPPPAPKPFPLRKVLFNKEHVKEFTKLKSEAQKYVKERQAYQRAKQAFESAKCRMEALMGILPQDKLREMEERQKVVQRQLDSCDEKIAEFTEAKRQNDSSVESAQQTVEAQQVKVRTSQAQGDSISAQQANSQLCTFASYLEKVKAYDTQLQKNLNILHQVKNCLGNEMEKLEKHLSKARKTRVHYKGIDDLRTAEQDVSECETRITFLNTKLRETKANIQRCIDIKAQIEKTRQDRKAAITAGNLTGGFGKSLDLGSLGISSGISIDNANNAVDAIKRVDEKQTIAAEDQKLRIAATAQPKLEAQQTELAALITNAEEELEAAKKREQNAREALRAANRSDNNNKLARLCDSPSNPTQASGVQVATGRPLIQFDDVYYPQFNTPADQVKDITIDDTQKVDGLKTLVAMNNDGTGNTTAIAFRNLLASGAMGGLTFKLENSGQVMKVFVAPAAFSAPNQELTVPANPLTIEIELIDVGTVNRAFSYKDLTKMSVTQPGAAKAYKQPDHFVWDLPLPQNYNTNKNKPYMRARIEDITKQRTGYLGLAQAAQWLKQKITTGTLRLMLVEVGVFSENNNKVELKNGYKTWRIPQDTQAEGLNLCVSMKYSNSKPVWVYVGECAFNFLPHGFGAMQQLQYKEDAAAQAASGAQAAAQGTTQAAAPESKVESFDWLGEWWLGERHIGTYVDRQTQSQKFACEFVHNAYRQVPEALQSRLQIAVRKGGEIRAFQSNERLALAYQWAMWLNHHKGNPDDKTKQGRREMYARDYKQSQLTVPKTMFAGGKKEHHHSKRMYEIAQMMKELAGGKNKEQLAELHLQAGQLLKEASHGIEMDRQTQMQVRQSSPIPPPPGLLGGSGGFGSFGTASLAERQQLVSDFKAAALTTLMGGSHRRVLGNEVANILCQQYA